jgi:hypothetical protein
MFFVALLILFTVVESGKEFDTLMAAIEAVERSTTFRPRKNDELFRRDRMIEATIREAPPGKTRRELLDEVNSKMGPGNEMSYSLFINSLNQLGLTSRKGYAKLPRDQVVWIAGRRRPHENVESIYRNLIHKFEDKAISYKQFLNCYYRKHSICSGYKRGSRADLSLVHALLDDIIRPGITDAEAYEEVRKRLDPKLNHVPSWSAFSKLMVNRKSREGNRRSYTVVPKDQRDFLSGIMNASLTKSEAYKRLTDRFKDEAIPRDSFTIWWRNDRRAVQTYGVQ